MGLSYEDRWTNLRRRLEDDAALLAERSADLKNRKLTTAGLVVSDVHGGISHALRVMDELDRTGAHRA